MTKDELEECNGFSVQVDLDGENALGRLILSPEGPSLEWPPPVADPPSSQWDEVTRIPITEEDITNMTISGGNTLYSKIRLSAKNGKSRIP